jgi:hypothetical protein
MSRVARMRCFLVAAVVAVVLFVLATGSAFGSTSARTDAGPIPRGYAQVKNGETRQRVIALLGRRFGICTSCAPLTWIYRTGFRDPIAIVVRFEGGTVASHFLIRPQQEL